MVLIILLLLCAVYALVTVLVFHIGRRRVAKKHERMYAPADYDARLKKLKEQRKSGLISKQEFKQQQKTLLGRPPEDTNR